MHRSQGSATSFVAAMMVVSSVFFLVASPAFAARGLSQVVGILPSPSTKENMWEVSKAGGPTDPLAASLSVIVRLKTGDGVIESNGDVDAKAARTLARINTLAGVMSVETLSKRAGIHKLEVDKSSNVDKILAKMARWKHVLSAEQDQIVQMISTDFASRRPLLRQRPALWHRQDQLPWSVGQLYRKQGRSRVHHRHRG